MKKRIDDIFLKNTRNISLSLLLVDVEKSIEKFPKKIKINFSSHYKTKFLVSYQNYKPISHFISNIENEDEIF